MVDIEFETIWKRLQEELKRGGPDAEEAGKSEDELRAEYRSIAERRVRLGLLLSEVGRRNNIQVTQDELNRALVAEAQRYPGQEREVFEFFRNTPRAIDNSGRRCSKIRSSTSSLNSLRWMRRPYRSRNWCAIRTKPKARPN